MSTSTLGSVRSESARAVLGHAAHRAQGGWRVHLIEVRDGSPGGVNLAATCGGIQPWVRVDSSLKPEEWREWKEAQAPIKDWPEWAAIQRVDCLRCEGVYAKRRARATAH